MTDDLKKKKLLLVQTRLGVKREEHLFRQG